MEVAMRYIWEAFDIYAGRKFQANHRPSEIAMIGFDPALPSIRNWLVFSLNDGMLIKQTMSKEELANWLNENSQSPMDIRFDDYHKKD
jgi:hypothetical protein